MRPGAAKHHYYIIYGFIDTKWRFAEIKDEAGWEMMLDMLYILGIID